MKKGFIFLFVLLISLVEHSLGATRFSVASGNWNATSTWASSSGGTAGASVPIAGDDVIIERSYTVTITTNAACSNVQIGGPNTGTNQAGTLTFSGSFSLTVSGNTIVGGYGNTNKKGYLTYVSGSTVTTTSLTLGGTGATPAAGIINMTSGGTLNIGSGGITANTVTGNTWTSGAGTVNFTATNTLPQNYFTSFYNVNFSGGNSTMAANSVTVTNTASVSATATLSISTGTLTISGGTGNDNLIVLGTVNQSGGLYSNTQFTLIQSGGVYNLSGGTFTGTKVLKLKSGGIFNLSGGTAYINGGITSNNSADRINQTGGTLQFANTQTWAMAGIYNATAGTAIFNGITDLSYSGTVAAWNFYNLQINSGKSFDQVSVININVAGNWTNNGGTFISSDERVTFNGSTAQTVTGTSGTIFDSLTINNTSSTGVTLAQPVTVTDILTLTDGYVYTDATNLMIINNNAKSSSGSVNSFVSGPMKKIGNDSAFVFPVGSAGTTKFWARLEMVNDTNFKNFNADTEFTCRYYRSPAPYNNSELMSGGLKYVSYVEYWDLQRTYDVADNAQCNVRLYWENSDSSGITDLNQLRVAHYNPLVSYYQNHVGVATSTGALSGYITSTYPATSFSPFTFGSPDVFESGINPLPIELLDFDAALKDNSVELTWSTASEINNDYFTVERSSDGVSFKSVDQIDGAGNSKRILRYTHLDEAPLQGISYYRIKQTDFDGKSDYSAIRKVVVGSNNKKLELNISPNPCAGNSCTISVSAKAGVLVLVFDTFGREVYRVVLNAASVENTFVNFTLPNLSPGVYLVNSIDGDNLASQRVVVN